MKIFDVKDTFHFKVIKNVFDIRRRKLLLSIYLFYLKKGNLKIWKIVAKVDYIWKMKIFDVEDTFHFKVNWFNWFKNVFDTSSKKKITIIHLFNLNNKNLKDRYKGLLYLENEDFRCGGYFSL